MIKEIDEQQNLNSFLLRQQETPLFNVLKEYVNRGIIPFHVPGHKKGHGIEKSFKDFMGENPFKIDVTVFDLVDSLHHPTGAIKEAQELLAEAYNADHSFFSVQGTSGAILAMIISVLRDEDKIIIPRNAHKAIMSGVILSGAVPVYVDPEVDERLGIAQGVTTESIKKALEENPDTKAVLIINPTYYGIASDIREIVKIVHGYNIPLLVDEAHGPHLAFSDDLPVSALEAGADICCQSTHKIIGAMTQCSVLHLKSRYISSERVQQVLNVLQTTSPSYILMASLDCARKQIALHGRELISYAVSLTNYAREEINKIPGLYCFGRDLIDHQGVYDVDTTKVTISCRDLGITGAELEKILVGEFNIQMDLSDFYNVLATCTFGDTKKSIDALIDALKKISKRYYGKRQALRGFSSIPEHPKKILEPRQAFFHDKKSIPIKDSIGEVSAEFLMAYPPGIPVLCPGEIITKEIVDYVYEMKQCGLKLQGTEDPDVENIKVIK